MSERSQMPAVYTPGRDQSGKFIAGNQLSVGHSNEYARRLKVLKAQWLSAVTDEDMQEVHRELVRLALHAKNEDVRLRALIYFFDRTLGRPQESIEIDLNGEAKGPLVNIDLLTPEEVEMASRIVARVAGQG